MERPCIDMDSGALGVGKSSCSIGGILRFGNPMGISFGQKEFDIGTIYLMYNSRLAMDSVINLTVS